MLSYHVFLKQPAKNLIKLLFANQNEPNSNTDNIVLIIFYRNTQISTILLCLCRVLCSLICVVHPWC